MTMLKFKRFWIILLAGLLSVGLMAGTYAYSYTGQKVKKDTPVAVKKVKNPKDTAGKSWNAKDRNIKPKEKVKPKKNLKPVQDQAEYQNARDTIPHRTEKTITNPKSN